MTPATARITQTVRNRVVSRDGTGIEYVSRGSGPGIVVIPGALAMAVDLGPLAELLSADFTVHVIERRGRGCSGPQGDGYRIDDECDDVAAVCAATGSRRLFGHSYGGLVALRAALDHTGIDAVAVYEPGVSVDGSIPVDWIPRASAELEAGEASDAFLTFIRGVNPAQTGRVPRWMLRRILKRAIPAPEMTQKLALRPQAVREHAEVGRLDSTTAEYTGIRARTLLMHGGRRTPSNLGELERWMPSAETVSFPRRGHFAPEQRPDVIAGPLREFFT
jgi:pimeloyl-ACP methyl ester carboxylesterase